MRLHLTCSRPTRSAVLAVQTARRLLAPCGHELSVSWPEPWRDEGSEPRIGLNRTAINAADVIVHFCDSAEIELPRELTAALHFGKPVVRYELDGQGSEVAAGEATLAITRAERLPNAIAEALASTIG